METLFMKDVASSDMRSVACHSIIVSDHACSSIDLHAGKFRIQSINERPWTVFGEVSKQLRDSNLEQSVPNIRL